MTRSIFSFGTTQKMSPVVPIFLLPYFDFVPTHLLCLGQFLIFRRRLHFLPPGSRVFHHCWQPMMVIPIFLFLLPSVKKSLGRVPLQSFLDRFHHTQSFHVPFNAGKPKFSPKNCWNGVNQFRYLEKKTLQCAQTQMRHHHSFF